MDFHFLWGPGAFCSAATSEQRLWNWGSAQGQRLTGYGSGRAQPEASR